MPKDISSQYYKVKEDKDKKVKVCTDNIKNKYVENIYGSKKIPPNFIEENFNDTNMQIDKSTIKKLSLIDSLKQKIQNK